MKKLLLRTGLVLLAMVVAFVVIGLLLPRTWQVRRQTVIAAPPAAIAPYVGELREWPKWIPWTVEKDPSMKIEYGEQTSGVGGNYSWKGDLMGTGTVTIDKADPDTGYALALSMEEGKYRSRATIDFQPVATGTEVTWTVTGELGVNPIGRYFGLMFDSMMGGDLESGLARLKQLAESHQADADDNDQDAEEKPAQAS